MTHATPAAPATPEPPTTPVTPGTAATPAASGTTASPVTPRIVTTTAGLRAMPHAGERAVVMTMGALHEGHAALVRAARERVGPASPARCARA